MKILNRNEEHTASEDAYPDSILRNKRVYAFGDSIVYGHTAPEKSFSRIMADDYGMELTMCAVNGASVMTLDSAKEDSSELATGNYIIKQIINAPSETPDIILFNGGTNDAYGTPGSSADPVGDHINLFEHIGAVQGPGASEPDTTTFCGGFERIIHGMRQRWGNIPIVYVTTHRSGGRGWEPQCKVRELALEICAKWGVETAAVFNDAELDTRDAEQMARYIINGAGSHPNERACRKFYIPIIKKKLKEILVQIREVVPDNVNGTVDLADSL